MQAKVLDHFPSKANGTHLQGSTYTTFDTLVELLGESSGSGDKVTQEWIIEFSDGTIATIYDWKEYSTPMGLYDWHIGGHSRIAVEHVEALLDGIIEIVENFDEEELN